MTIFDPHDTEPSLTGTLVDERLDPLISLSLSQDEQEPSTFPRLIFVNTHDSSISLAVGIEISLLGEAEAIGFVVLFKIIELFGRNGILFCEGIRERP